MLNYTDLETTGFNPKIDKIITIQYQRLDNYGNPIEDLIVLKEWESSEEEIVKKFYNLFMPNYPFDFISIGQNLLFDYGFLFEKFKKYGLIKDDDFLNFIYKKPTIDIHSILIIMNNLQFRGSGLDNFTNKKRDGSIIPIWYSQKEYGLIEDYIKQETESFLKAFQVLCIELPKLKELLK